MAPLTTSCRDDLEGGEAESSAAVSAMPASSSSGDENLLPEQRGEAGPRLGGGAHQRGVAGASRRGAGPDRTRAGVGRGHANVRLRVTFRLWPLGALPLLPPSRLFRACSRVLGVNRNRLPESRLRAVRRTRALWEAACAAPLAMAAAG